MKTVVIIGGGASGMMAALSASENPENRIILLERQQRVGKKLLATGNGRCNLTNVGAKPANYHGEQPEFAVPALQKLPPEKVLEFFRKLGLLTVTEYGGRVYPLSNSANSVVDVLRFALQRDNIELRTSTPARQLYKHGEGFVIKTDEGSINADFVIVACGGAAGAKIGGVTDGYELLKGLGHKRTALRPSLVQLVTDPAYPRSLKGVRAQAALRLTAGSVTLAESRGELQFTETGLSGPAAFDISRAASFCGEGGIVHIDFLPDYDEKQIAQLLSDKASTLPTLAAEELLTGVLHNRLGKMIVKYSDINPSRRLYELNYTELCRAAASCKSFEIALRGVEGFDSAQVTAGGIKTTGVNPQTMESWFVPHLFICGELLDIDADCGGYNLQWAWASGYVAGRLGE
ncbi:MAG: aminoacetone oxidase family FAD-binding enzyme [Oscillospiraceae bacterium]|nr:aminoacetone oxidase family FAD-binding enzyme [Oscillospiraceae bacterium]